MNDVIVIVQKLKPWRGYDSKQLYSAGNWAILIKLMYYSHENIIHDTFSEWDKPLQHLQQNINTKM